MKIAEHLHISSLDGSLYDTRVREWHTKPPLRAGFRQWFRDIATVSELKSMVRVVRLTLNRDQIQFVTGAGETIGLEEILANFKQVVQAVKYYPTWKSPELLQWQVIGAQINNET